MKADILFGTLSYGESPKRSDRSANHDMTLEE